VAGPRRPARIRVRPCTSSSSSESSTPASSAVTIARGGSDFDQLMVLSVFRSRELHQRLNRFPPRSTYNALHPALKGYWQFFGRVDVGEGWFFHAPVPADTQAIVGDPNNPQQFEFYNYTGGNLAELNNSLLSEPTLALAYQNAFNDIANSELYVQYPQVQAAYNQALVAYFNGVNAGLSPITDIES